MTLVKSFSEKSPKNGWGINPVTVGGKKEKSGQTSAQTRGKMTKGLCLARKACGVRKIHGGLELMNARGAKRRGEKGMHGEPGGVGGPANSCDERKKVSRP